MEIESRVSYLMMMRDMKSTYNVFKPTMFLSQFHNSSSSYCLERESPSFLANQEKLTMRASSSSSSSSSSSHSLAATSLRKRLKTVFKKAYELSILCQIGVCVIYYGPNGELKTWPKEREKVIDLALRYKAATKRKNSLNLHEFLEEKKEKEKDETNLKKKKKTKKRESENVKYPDWYPVFDQYSPNQLYQLILSLERTLSRLQERLRFVEAQKQRNTNLVHQSLTPSSLNMHHHQYQTQPLNPSQFSLYLYSREDATFSQLPLSASHSIQPINNQNHSMMQQQGLYGFDHRITNINFQYPCVSNTQDHSALLLAQASGLNNHLMQQQDLYGSHRNMCTVNDITNSNVLRHPYLSNTVPDEFCSDLQKSLDGHSVGGTSFFQDFQDLHSANDQSSLLQTSSLPSLHTISNSYLLPDNSRFL